MITHNDTSILAEPHYNLCWSVHLNTEPNSNIYVINTTVSSNRTNLDLHLLVQLQRGNSRSSLCNLHVSDENYIAKLILDNEVAQWYLVVGSDSPQRLPSQLVENRFPCWTLPWPSSVFQPVSGGDNKTQDKPLSSSQLHPRLHIISVSLIRSDRLLTRTGFILFLQ